jgi:hypothetical protein
MRGDSGRHSGRESEFVSAGDMERDWQTDARRDCVRDL